MASVTTNEEQVRALVPGVNALLRAGIAEATELVVADAMKKFEAELRRKIGEAAIDISHFYDLRMDHAALVITIKDYKTRATETQR
jgi:hypothetical protein